MKFAFELKDDCVSVASKSFIPGVYNHESVQSVDLNAL